MEGHGDLVSTLIKGIIGVIIWLIGVIDLLIKSPLPSKYSFHNYHLWNFRDTPGFDLEVKLETPTHYIHEAPHHRPEMQKIVIPGKCHLV